MRSASAVQEQSLHQVQPTSAGRSEMQHAAARMPRQPGSYFADLVRTVVVHHQVNFKSRRNVGVNFVQKLQEFLMPVPPVAVADGDTAGDIQRREKDVTPCRS